MGCDIGYKLNINVCELTNCSNDSCDSCINDKNLFTNDSDAKVCEDAYEHVTTNCNVVNYNGGQAASGVTCTTCNVDRYSFAQRNACILSKYLGYKTFHKTNISNCQIYHTITSNSKKCSKCEDGFFLSSDHTTCTQNCTKNYVAVQYGNDLDPQFFNVCVGDSDSDKLQYMKKADIKTALSCQADYYPVFTSQNLSHGNITLNYYFKKQNDYVIEHPLTMSLNIVCTSITNDKFEG